MLQTEDAHSMAAEGIPSKARWSTLKRVTGKTGTHDVSREGDEGQIWDNVSICIMSK
jgi:hypothetical protein